MRTNTRLPSFIIRGLHSQDYTSLLLQQIQHAATSPSPILPVEEMQEHSHADDIPVSPRFQSIILKTFRKDITSDEKTFHSVRILEQIVAHIPLFREEIRAINLRTWHSVVNQFPHVLT